MAVTCVDGVGYRRDSDLHSVDEMNHTPVIGCRYLILQTVNAELVNPTAVWEICPDRCWNDTKEPQISFALLVLKGLLLNQRTIQCPKCSISVRTIVSSGDSPVQVLARRSWPALWENFSSTVAYRVLNSVDTCIFSRLSPTPLLQSLSTPPKVDKHFSG